MQVTTKLNQPPRPSIYDVAAGTIRVQVLPAHICESAVDGQKIIEYDHRVHVTTDDVTGTGRRPGYVTVRGRRYRIDRTLRRERHPFLSRQGEIIRWTVSDTSYGGGFQDERGSTVSSKAYTALRHIELEVLERFEADLPDWRKVSEWMCDVNERQRWQDIAATLRTELADAEQAVAYFTARVST